ncbi:MAG: S46 family peptidase, partial [Victivallales bacterium]|nr:S46 family peptidase [Victivallales bacterium]
MKRFFLPLLAFLVAFQPLRADEGMWLPALISQRIADMQAKGFKLSAEDVYSVNQASLKDAVVLFGSGCTGDAGFVAGRGCGGLHVIAVLLAPGCGIAAAGLFRHH